MDNKGGFVMLRTKTLNMINDSDFDESLYKNNFSKEQFT